VLLVGAAYCLGSVRERRKLAIGAAVLVAWFEVGLLIDLVGGRSGDVAPIAVWLSVGFGVGYLISRRTEQAHLAWEANRVLAAEHEHQTQRAVDDERARIARELHDVVAHGLSVIVVQAVAERRSLRGPTVDQGSIDAALSSIEKTGREALVDLRRLLGLLRRPDDPMALTPQPGLDQLDELVSSVREAGLQVELEISGDRAPLPPGLDLTAYRIVQEALTNVLKHADAHCVHVRVGYQRTHLDLEVSDDGSLATGGGIAPAGPGQGLIGMRERVNVFGGTVRAGAAAGGGWTVHARLPVAVGVG
jgi:signal transduction histidine kinase